MLTQTWFLFRISSRCCFSAQESLKAFSHCSQPYGFSLAWTLWWVFKGASCEKAFPHWSQLYSFSTVWIFWCILKLLSCPRWSQGYSFSPEWMQLCFTWDALMEIFRCDVVNKAFSHWNSLSVWVLRWILRHIEVRYSCMVSLQYELFGVFLNYQVLWKRFHSCHSDTVFLQYSLSNEP